MTRICDLTQGAAITAAVEALRADCSTFSFNNAGVAYYGPSERMTAAQWDALLAVTCSRRRSSSASSCPVLVAQEEAHILNVCSIFGLLALRKGADFRGRCAPNTAGRASG